MNDELMDPEPFRQWLKVEFTFPDGGRLSFRNMADAIGFGESRLISIYTGQSTGVPLGMIDEAFVRRGCPEKLYEMYPLEPHVDSAAA